MPKDFWKMLIAGLIAVALIWLLGPGLIKAVTN